MCWRKNLETIAVVTYNLQVTALKQGYNTAKESAEWVGGVLQGDFKEDQTVAQIITNAVISSIPIVGWVADGRDAVANIIKLTDEKNRKDFFIWLALVATLIGIIPGVGDAIKAVIKIVISKGVDSLKPILRLFERLGLGDRIKLLKDINWGKINQDVLAKFNEIMSTIISEVEKLLDMLPAGLKDTRIKIKELLKNLKAVKNEGQAKVQEAVFWIRDKLNELIRKYEANPEYSTAKPNALNLRRLKRSRLTGATDADEVAQIEAHNLQYANKNAGQANSSFGGFGDEKSYREHLRKEGLDDLADDNFFFRKEKYKDFANIEAQSVMPNKGNDGYLYRVVDQHSTQGAKPAGSYWSLTPPKGTEDQWRAGSAVKRQWNEDGQYVRMKIPDEGLPAMTGTVARQTFEDSKYVIPGGDQQLYIPRAVVEDNLKKQKILIGKDIDGNAIYNPEIFHNTPWNSDGKNSMLGSEGNVWENGQ